MFKVYINKGLTNPDGPEVYAVPTWMRIKAFLLTLKVNHAYVTQGDQHWNVSIRNERMSKRTA